MAKANNNPEFDFAQRPLSYRIIDGITGFMNKQSDKKLDQDFDRVIYFKTESRKTSVGELRYIVFYTDSSVVCPDLSPKQISMIKEAGKGFIGFKQMVDKVRGRYNTFSVKHLDRAHSYPCNLNLDLLIENNAVLPLQ